MPRKRISLAIKRCCASRKRTENTSWPKPANSVRRYSRTLDGEGRRDPFDPLTLESSPEAGPRFEVLRLTGVFLGSPGNSLIVLEDPTRRGHFLRVGESIGEARLVQIQPQSAVFDVEEYGTVRREVLRLERSEEKP